MGLITLFLNAFLIFSSFCVKAETSSFKKYTIEQFLDTTSSSGGSFSFDEKRILFSSDETGVFNVFAIDLFSGKKEQLTFSKNHAISLLSSFPEDERFLYTSDDSGNELNHIFLWEGKESARDLTPYPGARSEFVGWSHDFASFFFNSNKRDAKCLDLYEMDIKTFTPKLIYKNDTALILDCISNDKRMLALHKVIDQNSSEIYLYDLSTNCLKSLFSHEKNVANVALEFSLDSKILYFLTNKGSEFSYVKAYDLSSGNANTIEKYDWDITDFHFSQNGRYRVTMINEDGKSKVSIYDCEKNHSLTLPEIAEGDISAARFSRSENSLAFTVKGSRTPRDLYTYDLLDGKTRRLTHSLSSAIDAHHLVEGKVIRFASYDGMKIPAIYYQPHQAKKDQKTPALIWVHGGPGDQSRLEYQYLIQYLANQGYAILAVNNRGSSGYGKTFFKAADKKHGEADLDDCIAAKKFLISTEMIDEKKIGIIGGSYGGYITLAALAFRPNEMAVGIDIFGVSNWVRTLKSIPPYWEAERESLYQKIGNPDKEAEYLTRISPLFHAKKIVKPLLVIQGANDPRVLKVESDDMIAEIKENGIPHQYLVFEDEGHGFAKKKNKMQAAIVILEFLNTHLR